MTKWAGLIVLTLPCVLVALDAAVLNLALPAIQADLHPSGTQQLWIADSYTFVVAGSLIAMGVLGDRIGRRRLLFAGSAGFAAASLFAAFAPTAGLLIAARVLTGFAGAALAPCTLALVRTMFTDDRRRRLAIGVWTASFGLGGILAPLVGGALVEHFWWGSVFLIGVPVIAPVLLLGPYLLPEAAEPGTQPFDPLGAALSLGAVLSVVYGLKRLADHGPHVTPALAVALGAALGVAFAGRQRRHPMVDLSLFRRFRFTAALAAIGLVFFVLYNAELATAQYLQLVAGLAPLAAGLWGLPGVLAYLASAAFAPALARRRPREQVIAAGLVVVAAGFAVLACAPGVPGLVAGSVIFSLGLGPVYGLATELIVESAPPSRAGAAAAIGETGAELGGALGIAVLGSLGLAVFHAVAGPDAVVAGVLSGPARHAYAAGFVTMTATSAVLVGVVALVAAVTLRRRSADNERTGTAHVRLRRTHQGGGATTRRPWGTAMIVQMHRRPDATAAASRPYGPTAVDLPITPAAQSPTPVVAVFGHPGRVAGLPAHLPGGWRMRRPADLDGVLPDEIVLFTAATVADVTLARAVLPRRTRVVALVDADAPAESVAGVLTAGADVCVRGGHPAILASHLVACRRRALAERWEHVDTQARTLDAQA